MKNHLILISFNSGRFTINNEKTIIYMASMATFSGLCSFHKIFHYIFAHFGLYLVDNGTNLLFEFLNSLTYRQRKKSRPKWGSSIGTMSFRCRQPTFQCRLPKSVSDTGFQHRSDTGFQDRSNTGFQYRSDTGFQYRSIIKGQYLFGIGISNTINIYNI